MSKLAELPYVVAKPKKRTTIKKIPHHLMPRKFYSSLSRGQQDLLSKINDEGLSFNMAAEIIGCSRQYLHQEYTKIRNLFLIDLVRRGKTYKEIAVMFGSNEIRIKRIISELVK